MLFTPCSLLGIMVFISAIAAVDLRQYLTRDCMGNTRTVCSDVIRQSCCRAGATGYRSASCRANDKKHKHAIYRGASPGAACSVRVSSKECSDNGNCISASTAYLSGHKWFFNHELKRDLGGHETSEECPADTEEAEETPCTNYVDPDLIILDGRAFRINGTDITNDQKGLLWDLFAEFSEVEDAKGTLAARSFPAIPSDLERFETTYEDSE